jgi:hypothetical protein
MTKPTILTETMKKHVELLKTRPGISFVPAATVSLLSLVNAVLESRVSTLAALSQAKPFSGGLIGPSSPIALLGVSGVFALSSYSVSKDISNGPSTATGTLSSASIPGFYSILTILLHIFFLAWCVAYLAMFGKSSILSKRPFPILLTGTVLASGLIYLREMLDLDIE